MADDLQHGDLAQIGGLLSTLISATPSRLRISLDGHKHLDTTAHMMLITNMPFLGPHFQISPNVSFRDGRLDVFTFSDMSKLNMLSYAMLSRGGIVKDAGIKHYRAKTCNDCFKPANACTRRRYSVRPGFIIRSCSPARPDGHGRHSSLRDSRRHQWRSIPSWRSMNSIDPEPGPLLPVATRQLPFGLPTTTTRLPAAPGDRTGPVPHLAAGGARASLWMALSAQRGLVVLLFLFALVTLSLIWSAGQRLDTRVFMLLNMRGYPVWLDRCMWLATQLGNMLTAVLAAFLLFMPELSPSGHRDHPRHSHTLVIGGNHQGAIGPGPSIPYS